jgi:TonB family protein
MFQVLIASGPQARPDLQRLVLSIGVHVALIGTAAGLAGHPSGTTAARPSEPELLYVAPPPARPSAPKANRATARPSGPLAPVWQLRIGLPDPDPVVRPVTVPVVADLLRGATLTTGPQPGPGAGGVTAVTPELLSADAVDDPVGIVEQPDPRYPAVLAQARVTGRVELSYVVDTLGIAEPGSLRILMSTHGAFDAAARASVLATRYRPARLHGSLVRQLVRQSFTFRLRQ